MDPFFTEEQLNNMSRENMMEVMRIMQNQVQKKETEVQLLKDKQKELEFMNAMLSDRLALAQRRRFGSSSEKYADGYEQMDLFNEAEVNADMDTAEIEEEIVIPSHKRKKRTGKKEEDLSNFEVTETIEYKLTGENRYCLTVIPVIVFNLHISNVYAAIRSKNSILFFPFSNSKFICLRLSVLSPFEIVSINFNAFFESVDDCCLISITTSLSDILRIFILRYLFSYSNNLFRPGNFLV